ncbi:MAG: hypothetical protein ABSD51_02040 [Candidatus Binatus sp.]
MRDNESDKTNDPPAFVSETVEEKFAQLLVIAEKCVRERATTPALILIYSAIDVAGWLSAANPSAKPSSRFTGWVTKYLLPSSNLDCSPIELYAARCGIVHNFSSESDLNRQNRRSVRQIVYSWGNADFDTLRAMTQIVNLDLPTPSAVQGRTAKYISIKVEDLISSFREGLIRFFAESKSDERLAARIQERSGKVLTHMSKAHADELLDWTRRLLRKDSLP